MYADEYISEFSDGGLCPCSRKSCESILAVKDLQSHLEKQYACRQEGCADVLFTNEGLQAHLEYTCPWGCPDKFCTIAGLEAHLEYKCPWEGCTDEFGINDGLQAPLEYTCPQEGCADEFCTREGLDTHLVADQGKERYGCFWQDCKSPVTTTLRSHLAKHMRRDRNTRREAQIRREKQMKKEAQVKLEIQIMRAHIRRRCDARSKRGHDDFNLVNLINSWKSEIQTRNRSTSSTGFEEYHPRLNPKEDHPAKQHISHPLHSNASNLMQDRTEQGSRTHPTSLATLRTDTSILQESTVNRLNQAGQQILRKGKVSSTDLGDIGNCSSPIGDRGPAPRARTRQALRRLKPKDIGELFCLTSLL
jgi:hypothetical protein